MRKLFRSSALRQAMALSAVFLIVLIIAAVLTLSSARRALDIQIDEDLKQRFDLIAASYDLTAAENDYLLTRALRYETSDFVGFIARGGRTYGYVPKKKTLVPGFQTTELRSKDGDRHRRWAPPWRRDRNYDDDKRDSHWQSRWKAWREKGGSKRWGPSGERYENIWRIYSGPMNGGTLIVGTRIEFREKVLQVLPGVFFISGFLVILVILSGGLVFGLLAQRRLGRMTATLQRISDGDLSARIHPGRNRDDLDDVALNIDSTADRLEVLMQQTRELSTSIAHDLKTPITRLKARLEEAEAAVRTGEGSAEALAAASLQADHLIHIFESLLQIAKLERGAQRDRFQNISLADLAVEVGDTFEPVIEDAGLVFKLDVEASGAIRGDRLLLTQALANLIENALRHGRDGGEIRLWAKGRAIGVSDLGPGIPEELRKEALAPLKQLDPSRSDGGAGLGLSIAHSIVRLHEAELSLRATDPVTGKGLTVEILF